MRFFRHHLVFGGIMLVIMTACGTAQQQSPAPPVSADATTVPPAAFTTVPPVGFMAKLSAGAGFVVNTHVPYAGELAGTDAFIPFDQTTQQLAAYPADKQALILVYCQSGRMSTLAAQDLVAAGYTNVWELTGGMLAWEQAGYPLINR